MTEKDLINLVERAAYHLKHNDRPEDFFSVWQQARTMNVIRDDAAHYFPWAGNAIQERWDEGRSEPNYVRRREIYKLILAHATALWYNLYGVHKED